jgi:Leucine-rich repeat (LRR) protein
MCAALQTVQRLTKLHALLVGSNALEDLPDGMAELRVLMLLDLSHNQLRVLSEAVGRLRRLRKLRLTGNPFCSMPSVVVDLQVGGTSAAAAAAAAAAVRRWCAHLRSLLLVYLSRVVSDQSCWLL